MIQKKGEWFLRDWMVALLLFSCVTVLLFIVSSDALASYGQSDKIDQNFRARYDRFQNSTTAIQEALNATSGEGGLSFVGTTDLIFQGTTSVISISLGGIVTFNSIIANIASDFGIPNEIAFVIFPTFIAVLAVILIFIIISSTTRNRA